jgi:hypothetical protein
MERITQVVRSTNALALYVATLRHLEHRQYCRSLSVYGKIAT